MQVMQPDSLFVLSLEAGCHHSNSKSYKFLPPILKEKLLRKLTKRGICSSDSFSALVHHRLNELDLRECSISEESLMSIEGLTEMQYLYLPQPPSVSFDAYSEAALIKVVKGKPSLVSLGLSGLHGVSDRVVSVVAGGSPHLVELHLQRTLISNQALYCLANLASLQCLNIAGTEVNDAGVEQLALGSAGSSLVELRLDGCSRLTSNSVRKLCKLMGRLRILLVHRCPNMSDEETLVLLDELRNRHVKQLTWTIY